MARGFDEPFGNSSAIPTFYCAALARAGGKELLVAGDGGDEIFGGNERYAKDQVFGWYHRSPGVVRAAARLLARSLDGIDLHAANRVANIIRRGEMPNPDRFYSDDNSSIMTLDGGSEKDYFQIGQMFGADRIAPYVAAGDEIATVEPSGRQRCFTVWAAVGCRDELTVGVFVIRCCRCWAVGRPCPGGLGDFVAEE